MRYVLSVLLCMGMTASTGCGSPPTYEICGINETAHDLADASVSFGSFGAGLGDIVAGQKACFGLFTQPVPQSAVVTWTDSDSRKHSVTVSLAAKAGQTFNGWVQFHIKDNDVITVVFKELKE